MRFHATKKQGLTLMRFHATKKQGSTLMTFHATKKQGSTLMTFPCIIVLTEPLWNNGIYDDS
jgi:hypothetical protein